MGLSKGVMDTWAMVVRRVESNSFANAFNSLWFSTSFSEIPPMSISLDMPQKQMDGWL